MQQQVRQGSSISRYVSAQSDLVRVRVTILARQGSRMVMVMMVRCDEIEMALLAMAMVMVMVNMMMIGNDAGKINKAISMAPMPKLDAVIVCP